MVSRIARQMEAANDRAETLRAAVPELAMELVAHGATRVMLFGSLVTGMPPHAGTDIDFAVEGMSEEAAASCLMEFLEKGFADVDLVRLENASPSLRRRIETDGVLIADAGKGHSSVAG